jgi:hypothetical protein
VTGALEVRHRHEGQEVTDVEAVGGGVEPSIEGDLLRLEQPGQSFQVRTLLDEPALAENLKSVRHWIGFSLSVRARSSVGARWPERYHETLPQHND